jgi:hypothetical protein
LEAKQEKNHKISDKTVSKLARQRFSQKMNKQIFVLFFQGKKQTNKFIHSILGESTVCKSACSFI